MRTKIIIFFKWSFVLTLLFLIIILSCDYWVRKSTEKQVFDKIKDVPNYKVGVVLGTSKYVQNGDVNLFYRYRIEAAAKLFDAGKIKYIIVSGDNRKKGYNEPELMKNSLIAKGVPANRIQEDFAGFRTLDSVLRAKEVFGQNNFIVISQFFHNQRAIFIANYYGIKMNGYNAQSVNYKYALKTQLREYLARVKAVLDFIF